MTSEIYDLFLYCNRLREALRYEEDSQTGNGRHIRFLRRELRHATRLLKTMVEKNNRKDGFPI